MDDVREEALRSALGSVISRYETAVELNTRPSLYLIRAMALDAVRGLAEAYPEDIFYQRRRAEWEPPF